MSFVLDLGSFLLSNWSELLSAFIGVLAALVAFFLLIPGEFPEKQLQAVLDFLKKFSRK
jgi:uncharacterized membrane protein YgaE (UPF0421/DUF939 family)